MAENNTITLSYVPLAEIRRVRAGMREPLEAAPILADIFRLNTLSMIMESGSGHIGSSFSAMDIVTWLWVQELVNPNDKEASRSDTYFSSKGHDVPGLYSVLIGLEKLPFELIHKLRRLGGLPGHPDIATPYLVTNTGPLGMGISKARGMAIAKRLENRAGRFYVLTGDGELQEGHLWESLQPTANGKFSEITVIVDHNKIQSDTWVKDVSDLGRIEERFRSFGWEVLRIDGHDFDALQSAFAYVKTVKEKPQVIIADTIKGRGASFMERFAEDGLYKFHSGAPSTADYQRGITELTERINAMLVEAGLEALTLETTEIPVRTQLQNPERLVTAYGDELVKIGRERSDLVVLDADLMLDCGVIPFKKEFPERFVECGIAEQDMVSAAGGLALSGKLPVVHSFACFLSTRPNEQIYNNASERTKIIYVAPLAGLLPAGPGHSHQSVRDISTLGSIPGLTLIEPANEKETRLVIRWAVEQNPASTYIRLVSLPYELPYELPPNYELKVGQGVVLREGKDALVIAYGPTMLREAMQTAEFLKEKISVAVMNFPWLNRVDEKWLAEAMRPYQLVFTLDDHYAMFGQGMVVTSAFSRLGAGQPPIVSFGLETLPECGQSQEALEYHRLDAKSLARRIEESWEAKDVLRGANGSFFDLKGEVAVITGGLGQLGSEYAKTLAHAGAAVAVFDVSERLNPKVAELIQKGFPVSIHKVDITNKVAVEAAVAEVETRLGTPTILINNAGIDVPPNASPSDNGPFEEYPEATWDALLDSHLKGMFLVSQAVVRAMRNAGKKGSIINVSSTYGVVSPDQSVYAYRRERGEAFYKPIGYSVAKSGVLNFTRWLAEYCGPYGIRVNTLVPGGVFAGQEETFTKEYNQRTMLGRMANVDEYNAAVLFLASQKASSYMTGSTFVVDGGWTAR